LALAGTRDLAGRWLARSANVRRKLLALRARRIGWATRDPVERLLHERDSRQAPEAEHAYAEPDDPKTREESGDESGAAHSARAAAVRGDEDCPLGRLFGGHSFPLDDCHKGLAP
jgi:hypothetical protein